jgi:predicted neutral ceramidase superfamily lipid hydrolase
MSGASTEAGTDDVEGTEDGGTYSGLLTAVPYAFRQSDSVLFRGYAVLGGLLALGIALLFGFALIVVVAATTGGAGGTLTLSRSFFIVVGLFVVAPVLAPILLVARHHRRVEANREYDAALAAVGFLFITSLYLATVISVPESQQVAVSGALAPVAGALYGLPAPVGIVPPLAVVGLLYAVHRAKE